MFEGCVGFAGGRHRSVMQVFLILVRTRLGCGALGLDSEEPARSIGTARARGAQRGKFRKGFLDCLEAVWDQQGAVTGPL